MYNFRFSYLQAYHDFSFLQFSAHHRYLNPLERLWDVVEWSECLHQDELKSPTKMLSALVNVSFE